MPPPLAQGFERDEWQSFVIRRDDEQACVTVELREWFACNKTGHDDAA